MIKIDGFAEKSSKQIITGLKESRFLIQELFEVGIKIKEQKNHISDGKLSGKIFVITGELSIPRKAMEEKIKKHGGKVSSSVSSNTTAVISNEKDSSSSKMKKALALNISVWSEETLNKMLNKQTQ